AFNELVINHMMTSKEEWDFVHSLKFDEQLEYEEAYFIKMNYISMLKKYEHVTEIQEARSELENKFRLSNNADILLSRADELYTQCRFKECLEVTTNKASTMDSHCGPAWVGFGHTFAIESEHDQAITAYSTAAKLYPGSHLPTLFIGMQHLQAKNLLSAEEYLLTSSQICENDPLVLNELGVLYFQKLQYAQSVDFFKKTLKVAEETKCRPQIWETIWINLGHAFRQLGELDIAESYFQKVVSMSPPNSDALTALGYIYHVKEEFEEAIMYYHEALGICPYDPITHDLLSACLREMVHG
ncbi:10989_t:CDS:2, partial [Cetraspora pellucida]